MFCTWLENATIGGEFGSVVWILKQGSGTNVGLGMVHAPLSLFPTSFPQNAFMQAVQLATDFNILIDRVSQDAQFLQQALARFVLPFDDLHESLCKNTLVQAATGFKPVG